MWAPGQTLSVTLVDSPEWKSTFGSTANAVRFLDREVLGAWSAIETADIRWEIGRVAEEDEAFGETDTYVYRGGGTYGLAVMRDRKIVACRVSLGRDSRKTCRTSPLSRVTSSGTASASSIRARLPTDPGIGRTMGCYRCRRLNTGIPSCPTVCGRTTVG